MDGKAWNIGIMSDMLIGRVWHAGVHIICLAGWDVTPENDVILGER